MQALSVLADSPALAAATALVLGLLVGSFLNVVIHRVPKMMEREWELQAAELAGREPPELPAFNLVRPRSRCPSCGHTLGAFENIPLLSWTLQRGRCRACGWSIPARYPLVELGTGLLSALAIAQFGATAAGAGALLFTWALVALTMIDFDHQLLPDSITLPLLWLGLLVNSFGVLVPLADAVWGAVLGYLSLWSVYWAFRLLTGKEGMGFGDFKLLAALGAWLGWQALPLVIILSSLVGAVVGVALIFALGRDRNVPIPFGPYLAAAGWITLLWGDAISGAYLSAVTP